jgi:hypothetical protein
MAHESALAIWQKLAEANPTVTNFQSDLATSHHNIGLLLTSAGKPAEGVAAYESALAVREKLARENPESPGFASGLGATLNNLAVLDLAEKRFEVARDRLQEAVESQRKALTANSANPVYRQYLANHLINLITASRGLNNAEGTAEAERELAQLRDSDPAFAALDTKLAAIVKGVLQAGSEAERLALAQRAYDKRLFVTSARLWIELLEAHPALADNRQAQHRYNAACSAALAALGEGRDNPPPDDAAKARLRQQAARWLKAELATWTGVLATADRQQRVAVTQTLAHWQQDTDLAGIRDVEALAKLPDGERQALGELWADVAKLRQKAEARQDERVEP